jgi:hypothetical protein
MSSKIHPGGFDQPLPATIASAAVDRFMHHAHVVVTDGDSYRFTHARDGKAVTPLPLTLVGRTDGQAQGVRVPRALTTHVALRLPTRCPTSTPSAYQFAKGLQCSGGVRGHRTRGLPVQAAPGDVPLSPTGLQ